MRSNKKGFTIVELVIVIAVIAILAAVLIPTVAGLVKKANISADQQAVKQMNSALAIYAAENGNPKDIIEVKKALDESLVNVNGGLVPVTQGYAFYWDSANNQIILVSSEDEIKSGWKILTANSFGSLVKVETAADLKNAIATSSSNKPALIKLNADLALDDAINVEEGNVVTIDLNGKKLTTSVGSYTTLSGKTSKAVIMVDEGATLNIEGGNVIIPENGNCGIVNQNGSLTLKNTTVTSSALAAIFVDGHSDTAIVDSDITVKSTGFAITANSNSDASDGISLSIVDSDIVYDGTGDGAAIYMPVSGNVSIENSNVVGTGLALNAIYIRGCNLYVKDSSISFDGTSTSTDWKTSGNYGPAGAIDFAAGGNGYSDYAKLTWENSTIEGGIYVNENGSANVVISGIEVPAENWTKN